MGSVRAHAEKNASTRALHIVRGKRKNAVTPEKQGRKGIGEERRRAGGVVVKKPAWSEQREKTRFLETSS